MARKRKPNPGRGYRRTGNIPPAKPKLKTGQVLIHTVYDAVNVDDRMWVVSGDPKQNISAEVLGVKLSMRNPAKSIERAKKKASKMLGIKEEDVLVADYLKHWLE